jgi:23S rRNA pseudouridine2605 synthase
MYGRGVSRPPAPKEAQRIAKLLARAGIASRREVERMIAEGRVALDGKVLDTPATLVASLHGVTVDGNPVEAPRPARLFLFHKPTGVLTTERDPKGRPTIYDRLPRDLPRLIPVGRLDYNTEGLLLLTTDGGLKRQLELPATGVERAYRARAYGNVSQAQLEELIEGVEIDGIRYGSIDANLERRTGANVWIELVLTEGKNREVRRVLEHLGLEVSRLIRTRYGPFVLGDLPAGGIGEVRQHDLVAFRQALAKGTKAHGTVEVAPQSPSSTAVRSEPVEGGGQRPTPRPKRASIPPDHVRSRTEGRKPRPQSTSPLSRGRPTLNPGDRTRGPDAEVLAPPEKKPTPKRRPGWAKPKPKPGPKRRK